MRILSGIQPTGELHIGNYLGAAKHWAELQKEDECLFMIADLHALTTSQNPETFSATTFQKTVELLAAGIDPAKSVLFIQSHVREHTELAWLLNTLTPIGELERMTQYKDKAKKHKENSNAGLFSYPVLMTADILLYKSEGVPVGEDQTQHLELTRLLAKKFNTLYGNTFPEPKTLLVSSGARIMSLQNPEKKMSKSDTPDSCIGLFEEAEHIKRKVMKATTDTEKDIRYNLAKKPGISNLLTIYSLLAGVPIKTLEKKFKGKGYASFKTSLAGILEETVAPFRKKKKELETRELYVQEILKQGETKAHSIASSTMNEVRKKIGLL
ncbi:MAG: tryptophanyl-tRNA synthetase, partial [Parcubacteria group bacterium Greene0714_21]